MSAQTVVPSLLQVPTVPMLAFSERNEQVTCLLKCEIEMIFKTPTNLNNDEW